MAETAWQSIDSAPRDPVRVVAAQDGIPWAGGYGPKVALLCWVHDAPTLIRAAWHTRDTGGGQWRDLDFGDPVDAQILGWAALPTPDEIKALVEPGEG